MCGIIGAVSERSVTPILIEGLRRLEYRGYDSAGFALLAEDGDIICRRRVGKVSQLDGVLAAEPLESTLGIAHTRWATHGVPAERNSHPHRSRTVAVVHNGIIENHEELRGRLSASGFIFESETDTEVIAHLIQRYLDAGSTPMAALQRAVAELTGAFAIAAIFSKVPAMMLVARRGSPLCIGIGADEHFAASDATALLQVTSEFVYLDEGDTAVLWPNAYEIFDTAGQPADRPRKRSALSAAAVEKGEYRHYMLKEIHEQPAALRAVLQGRLADGRVLDGILGPRARELLAVIQHVHFVACGTSAHAGMVAKYWMERIGKIPCSVELASEFRYRDPLIPPGTLFVTISQSGETADTLEALRHARTKGIAAALAICNAPESSLVRESDIALMTHAGPERSVASTKAFTTQLMACALLMLSLARQRGLAEGDERHLIAQLMAVDDAVERMLGQDEQIRCVAERLMHRSHALFLGRGAMVPVAMEGALKLKEISYIHAEAYAAGELKHGPLALVDEQMPVVAVVPRGDLLDKIKSNLQEVSARGGELIVIADENAGIEEKPGVTVIRVPHSAEFADPILYTVPLQLLAYHVAVLKGTDVDQPRNLAKSVTVE
jgi:glutamine---fructose-6-phosphate transaminase (isomerizing)